MPTPRDPGPDLFASPQSGRKADAPLAERMRPREFADFVGQDEIVGPDRPLRKAIESDRLSSVIDRKSTRLNSSHMSESRMPSSA